MKTTEKGDKKAELQRVTEKEEITSTEFPEGGDTTYTKGLLNACILRLDLGFYLLIRKSKRAG